MMAPRIQSAPTRFHLYRDIHNLDAADFQKQLTAENADTNQGLRFSKFFGRWQNSTEPDLLKKLQTVEKNKERRPVEKPTQPLLDWLDPRKIGDDYRVPGHSFKTLKAGNQEELKSACKRLTQLAGEERGGVKFTLKLVSRLLIGIGLPHPTENGFLFHPTLGVPYVPGMALKQVAQDWAEEEVDLPRNELDRLFGGPEHGAGCIAFLDALPLEPVILTAEQITNHYGGYYHNIDPARPAMPRPDMHQPADWHEPGPVTLLAVEASFSHPLPFQFAILPLRGATTDDMKNARQWLTRGLEVYGAGARTTLGFGKFESEEGREEREQVIREAEQSAPPGIGDRVRILETHKRAPQRGKVGTITKVDVFPAFTEIYVDCGGGGEIKTFPEHVEKLVE